jgi:hypothetical protein
VSVPLRRSHGAQRTRDVYVINILLRIYSHRATATAKKTVTHKSYDVIHYYYIRIHTHDIVPVPGKRVRYRRQYDIAILICYYYIERPRSSPCIIS